ncbi:MAG: hypothetical protein LBR17_06750 [Bacteroidales bacterium]|nr:hypothetical protein [Bacteroidales bacterium]
MALLNKTFVSTAGWYVLYTMPRHEKKVYEELLSQRYVSYLPLIKYSSSGFFCRRDCEVVRHKGKDKIIIRIA